MPRMPNIPDTSSGASSGAPELLRLRDAEVRRGGRAILSIDDFRVCDGERVCILGPNGSGKSTLVGLLTREVLPVWRENPPLVFRGDPRAPLADVNRTVGVVSAVVEDRGLRNARNVLDVVLGGSFGAVGVPWHLRASDGQVASARRALADAGIAELADREMRTLSTGQVRRVLVARALAADFDVLVFDEPCSGLDVEAVWNLRETFEALGRAGRTVLLVTHDVADITPTFARVVMLCGGRIVADGPTSEVLTTARLRELFGVPVTLVESGGRYHLQ